MPELRTVFAGSPAFAATILAALADSPYRPVAVYTQPDRARGRGRKVTPNAVKQLASELGLTILQPKSLRTPDAVQVLSDLEPDIMIVAAYGLILPPEILAVPTYGCINVHASLLPRWRGAAPVERAIMAGDPQTGVCIMHMEAGLDSGPLYVSTHLPIEPGVSSSTLAHQLAVQGSIDLLAVLDAFQAAHNGTAEPPTSCPQDDSQATYAEKLSNADRMIDWAQSAEDLSRRINALSERLPVRVQINGTGIQLLQTQWIEQSPAMDDTLSPGTIIDASRAGIVVQCAHDLLQIKALKVERGKGKPIDAATAVNGFKDLFHAGARLT